MKWIKVIGGILITAILTAMVIISWQNATGNSISGELVAATHCKGCHDFTRARTNIKGPYLWGVVDRAAGTADDFSYSDTFLDHIKKMPFIWSVDNLDQYVQDPENFFPGTKMADKTPEQVTIPYRGKEMVRSKHGRFFAGLKEEKPRRDLLAYLATLR